MKFLITWKEAKRLARCYSTSDVDPYDGHFTVEGEPVEDPNAVPCLKMWDGTDWVPIKEILVRKEHLDRIESMLEKLTQEKGKTVDTPVEEKPDPVEKLIEWLRKKEDRWNEIARPRGGIGKREFFARELLELGLDADKLPEEK